MVGGDMKTFPWLKIGGVLFAFHVLWMISGTGPRAAPAAPLERKGKFAGMMLIPTGPFTMGRNGGTPDEKPAHKVHLPAFHIDKNLVTWAQYAEFIRRKGPAGPKGGVYLDVEDEDNRILPSMGGWSVEKGVE